MGRHLRYLSAEIHLPFDLCWRLFKRGATLEKHWQESLLIVLTASKGRLQTQILEATIEY